MVDQRPNVSSGAPPPATPLTFGVALLAPLAARLPRGLAAACRGHLISLLVRCLISDRSAGGREAGGVVGSRAVLAQAGSTWPAIYTSIIIPGGNAACFTHGGHVRLAMTGARDARGVGRRRAERDRHASHPPCRGTPVPGHGGHKAQTASREINGGLSCSPTKWRAALSPLLRRADVKASVANQTGGRSGGPAPAPAAPWRRRRGYKWPGGGIAHRHAHRPCFCLLEGRSSCRLAPRPSRASAGRTPSGSANLRWGARHRD